MYPHGPDFLDTKGKVTGLRQQPPLDQMLGWHRTSFVQAILHSLSEEEAAVPILQIKELRLSELE